jgi:two-component system invasion response regulator UvrY
MVNILMADDHAIVRYGTISLMRELLEEVTAVETANFDDTLRMVEDRHFDLLVLDINIPGGNSFQMIDVLRLRQPGLKILIFTAYDEHMYGFRYLQAGADGFLMKNSNEEEIKYAIRSVLNDEKYFGPSVKAYLLDKMNQKKQEVANPLLTLSNRETEVVRLLIQGNGIAEIARLLHLQISTVSTYKVRIFQKLNVRNIVELVERFNLYSGMT